MAEIGESIILPQPRSQQERDLYTVLQEFMEGVAKILNRGILFQDNVDCKIVEYTSNAIILTEDTVPHGLGRVPQGFIVIDRDADGNPPFRSAAHDATNIYLKCSTASCAFKLIVF